MKRAFRSYGLELVLVILALLQLMRISHLIPDTYVFVGLVAGFVAGAVFNVWFDTNPRKVSMLDMLPSGALGVGWLFVHFAFNVNFQEPLLILLGACVIGSIFGAIIAQIAEKAVPALLACTMSAAGWFLVYSLSFLPPFGFAKMNLSLAASLAGAIAAILFVGYMVLYYMALQQAPSQPLEKNSPAGNTSGPPRFTDAPTGPAQI